MLGFCTNVTGIHPAPAFPVIWDSVTKGLVYLRCPETVQANFQCFPSRRKAKNRWTRPNTGVSSTIWKPPSPTGSKPELVLSASLDYPFLAAVSAFVASGWKSLPVRLRAENALDCCCVSDISLGIRIGCCLTLQLSETRYHNNIAPSLCVCYGVSPETNAHSAEAGTGSGLWPPSLA